MFFLNKLFLYNYISLIVSSVTVPEFPYFKYDGYHLSSPVCRHNAVGCPILIVVLPLTLS